MNYTQQENCGSKEGFMGKELLMGHCCGFKVSTERIYEGKNGGATFHIKNANSAKMKAIKLFIITFSV